MEAYLAKYDVLREAYIPLLHYSFVHKFQNIIDEKIYNEFSQYQQKIYDLVEDLRSRDIPFLQDFFLYLKQVNLYLLDIILFSWCPPRPGIYLSKKMYRQKYAENIRIYLPILSHFSREEWFENFFVDLVSHSIFFPIHCLPLFWNYLDSYKIGLEFTKEQKGEYFKISLSEDQTTLYLVLYFPVVLELGIKDSRLDKWVESCFLNDTYQLGQIENKYYLSQYIEIQKFL